MHAVETLVGAVPAGRILRVHLGLFWTAVVAEVDGARRCGLAATLRAEVSRGREPDVPLAGSLTAMEGRDLAALALSSRPTEASIGLAAVNALLPPPGPLEETSAADLVARAGPDQRVAVVGHFPFVEELRRRVAELWVLELRPREGDLPAEEAPRILPRADAVVITAMTLMNGTFDGLTGLCRPEARVLLVGPSTPLSPLLFDFGVTALCGARVVEIESALRGVSEGANFHQLRGLGVHYATLVG